DEEAVRQDFAERRSFARGKCHQQRALEPAAVLVTPLEIHVRRPAELRVPRQHRFVTRTRVEPDVQDVAFAFEAASATGGAGQARRNELSGGPFVPGVRAVLLEDL